MHLLLKYIDKIPKTLIPKIGVLMVIFLGGIDYLTGYEISFSIFYFIPIIFVSWFGKRNHALFISFLSTATWLWADLTSGHRYSHFAIPVWNSTMRLGIFLIGVFSLSAIKTLLEREQTFARIDLLTGAANTRAFNEMAKIEINKSVRFSRPFTIAYIDIDNFKQVNDTLGHSQGDNLLQSVAATIKNNTRTIDMVARFGGDEFAIFLPETNQENAKITITKVQKHLLDFVKNNNWPVTFSIGAVTCYKSCNLDELIKEADNLMYTVKKAGKIELNIKFMKYQQEAHNPVLKLTRITLV
jgi:diguanylate cyclase (GGDEF)-like protein